MNDTQPSSLNIPPVQSSSLEESDDPDVAEEHPGSVLVTREHINHIDNWQQYNVPKIVFLKSIHEHPLTQSQEFELIMLKY